MRAPNPEPPHRAALGRLGRHPRRGGALLASLIAVLVVAGLAASFLQITAGLTRSQARADQKKQAFYLAEAGLAEAYAGLQRGKTGNVGTAETPAAFGEGLFWVEARDLGEGVVRLDAFARVRSGFATLSLCAERGETAVLTLGMFSGGKLLVSPGAYVDGWDSSLGTYEEQAGPEGTGVSPGRLGSNGPIALSGTETAPTTVLGDVTPGPDGTVAASGDVRVSGSTDPAPATRVLPPVEVPPIEPTDSVVHDGPVPRILAPGTHGLGSLSVGADAEVVVLGPATLVVGTVSVAAAGQLTFDTAGGPIDLYVTRALAWPAGSVVETTGADPSLLTVQVAGDPPTPLELRASSAFRGVFYAPGADVNVGSAFEAFGALIADRLALDGAVRLHFDRNLLAIARELAIPRLLSWRILEIGNVAGGIDADPFAALGVDPRTLPRPAEAHADQNLEISYYDGGGALQSYAGAESGFDFGLVSSVVSLARDGITVVDRTLSPVTKPTETAISDLYAHFGVAPGDESGLKSTLIANSPLSMEELKRALYETLNESSLRDVLVANAPLTSESLNMTLDRVPALSSSALKDVLISSSPLPADVLARITIASPLSLLDKLAVVAAQ